MPFEDSSEPIQVMFLDFQLRHLKQEAADPGERLHVLVRFKNKVSALRELGCEVTSVAGDVAAVFIPAGGLDKLLGSSEVVHVEASRTLKDETDVSSVDINLVEQSTGRRLIPGNGRGAIIGIIDSGFELTHPCFLDPPAKIGGGTRIIAAWDQANAIEAVGAPPLKFGYGIEYSREIINQSLADKKILSVKNQKGSRLQPHGTYVAGIAAGNGATDFIYKGMAPEADLVLVAYKNAGPVGGSAFTLDAIDYICRHARAYDNPVVINISQGDDLGAHDGKSLLERAIDYVVAGGRVLVVKSAGNGRHRPAIHHASGVVEQGSDFVLPFAMMPEITGPIDGDTIEIWYRAGDRFAVALKPPTGSPAKFIPAGQSAIVDFPAGNKAHVYSDLQHPTNGDNHIGIIFEKGDGWESGTWELILHPEEVRRGDFDAWVDRPNTTTVITFKGHQADASTVTLPGTAQSVITVGGFVSRPAAGGDTGEVKGTLALGSSIGPTRDGRIKPDITAPSTLIMAPRVRTETCPPRNFPPSYDLLRGTSMAAPHVAGAIALLWALWPELPSRQLREALYATARRDVFTGATPNNRWGHGKLDVGAAYKLLSTQSRNGETYMKDTENLSMRVTLESKDEGDIPVIVHFDVKDGEVVNLRGIDPAGESELRVSLLVRRIRAGGDECWACVKDPCPPNALIQVPCPGGDKDKDKDRDKRQY